MFLGRLGGWRVLVAEDSFLIASDLSERLRIAGAEVVGPFAKLEAAQRSLDGLGPGRIAAVLDVQLRDGLIYPLADRLRAMGAPLVFATGYDRGDLAPPYDGYPYCRKPAAAEDVLAALVAAVALLG